jgi:hypothetical protein
MPAPDLLVPTWFQLAGWAGVLLAAAAMTGLGRLMTGGRAPPEAALIAGWGTLCFVLTLWGVLTPRSMRGPAAALALVGLASLVLPRLRLARADWRALGRIGAIAVPLLLVMASARPAEPDTFLNLLPNAAYLHDHGMFPAADRAPAYSYLPTAPYNLQIAVFLAGLVTPGFPANGLIAFNIVLQLAAGLLLARLLSEDDPPSWRVSALGLLGATLLNPGFVPRYDLAGYGEPGVTVALAFAAVYALRAAAAIEARERAAMPLIIFTASLAALVNMKQDSVALALALVIAAAIVWRARAWPVLAAAALPAAILYLAWRGYVLSRMPAGELQVLPRAQWQIGAIGLILTNMLRTVAGKGVYFGAIAVVLGAAVWRWRRAPSGDGPRMAAILGILFLLYSLALVFDYVAVDIGKMGTDAHSYFRYVTHLSLVLMAAAALLLRGPALSRVLARPGMTGVLIAAMAVAPVAAFRYVRFDLEPPELRVWQLAATAAPLLQDGERVALLLPDDNGSVATMLGTILRSAPLRRPHLRLDTVVSLDAAQGDRHAILSCTPQGGAAVLIRSNEGWQTEAVMHYPPAPPGRWSHGLSNPALCL